MTPQQTLRPRKITASGPPGPDSSMQIRSTATQIHRYWVKDSGMLDSGNVGTLVLRR